tara:strand:- start:244 stop:1404 length:1161 start_codon:yes stop_codon:yes gene_type:complete
MSQTKAQLVSGTSAQDLTVDNINTTSINSGQASGRKNLIINGAMKVAQRGTSSTSSGIQSVDRMPLQFGNQDEAPTQAQVSVASGTTPYASGFRKAFKITNGNQTSGAGTNDYLWLQYKIEAQDIANSGWNYVSSSSNITLSFWVKSSVAQDFSIALRSEDGTRQIYNMTTGSLSADTWTKIVKTIPGNSNLQFDDNNAVGLTLFIIGFAGTASTTTGLAQNAWSAFTNSKFSGDMTSTWYTTNDSTLEMTGIQLEVGSTATDFEHRSFGEELALCQRYYYVLASGATKFMCIGDFWLNAQADGGIVLPVEMRSTPTLDHTNGADYYRVWTNGANSHIDGAVALWNRSHSKAVTWYATPDVDRTAGHANRWITNNADAHFAFSAEL